jgi:hypothetical protein
MKRPLLVLLSAAGLLLSGSAALPLSRLPDVMELLRTGQLRFKQPGVRGGISDSAEIVGLFGTGFERSTSSLHASLRGGGSLWNGKTHLRYKRQGVEFILNTHGHLFGIVLTAPYSYPIADDIRLGRVTYRELHQRYFATEHDSTAIDLAADEQGRPVFEGGMRLPDRSYCRGWLICRRKLRHRYGSFPSNRPVSSPLLSRLIQAAPLQEVYLQPPSY